MELPIFPLLSPKQNYVAMLELLLNYCLIRGLLIEWLVRLFLFIDETMSSIYEL